MSNTISNDPNVITLRVRGANGQATDMFVVEKYDGTDVFVVDKDGNVTTALDVRGTSYVVWKSGTTCYAKNGSNGGITSSSTSIATVLTAVIADISAGGKILVRNGAYSEAVATLVTINKANVTIEGEDKLATVFTNVSFSVGANGVTLRRFTVTGTVASAGTAISVGNTRNDATFEDVRVQTLTSCLSAFGLGGNCARIRYTRCEAIDIDGFGFYNVSDHGTDVFEDIWYEGCLAKNCGSATSNAWATGYDFSENPTLKNCFVSNCRAEGCWESGFHIEPTVRENVVISNCTSEGNGQKPGFTFGSGFCVCGDIRLTGCHAKDNLGSGFYFTNDVANHAGTLIIEGCDDDGSVTGISTPGTTGGQTFINDFVSIGAGEPIHILSGKNIHVENLRAIDPTGGNVGSEYWFAMLGSTSYPCVDCDFDVHLSCDDALTYGIYMGQGTRVRFSGHLQVPNVTECALLINGGTDIDVTDFKIETLVNMGVYVKNGTSCARIKVARGHLVDSGGAALIGIKGQTAGNVAVERETTRLTGFVTGFTGCKFDENAGKSTGTGAEQTIAHLLTVAPTIVMLSNTTALGCPPYQSTAADATNIYVTGVNGKPFAWEAKV